jgi:hydrogenase nickel incorporation protein HypA/HybF
MGLALEIVEIVKSSIPDDLENPRVERINVSVGRLAAVVPSSLQFCFQVAVKDTILEGAELRIEEIPVVARCRECSREWTISRPVFTCPRCQSGSVEVLSGRELDIRSIEVAQEEA